MIYYIRKCALKLVRPRYDVYPIMAELEERDKAIPAHVFATPARAIAHFLKLFYDNREKIKLTTRYNIDPVSLQKIGEDEGLIIVRLDAEQLAIRLTEKYPNLVWEILMRENASRSYYSIRRSFGKRNSIFHTAYLILPFIS